MIFYVNHPNPCPKVDDSSTSGLYIRHVCCNKCSSKSYSVVAAFNHGRMNQRHSIIIIFIVIFFLLCNDITLKE